MNTTNVLELVRAHKLITLVVIVALLMWALGVPQYVNRAGAASITTYSDTLSDSDLSALSDHHIRFTTPNGLLAGGSIRITFNSFTFDNGPDGFDFNDVDLLNGGVNELLASTPSGASWGVATSSNWIEIQSGTDVIASSTAVEVVIGLAASSGATGNSQLLNPGSTNSYVITTTLASTTAGQDSADGRVAIIDDVVVTASIDTTLLFTITGLGLGQTVNSSPTTTATTTTSTSLPFESLVAATSKVLAQRLNLTTNAVNGFTVTIEHDQDLQSSTGATIDGFSNGAYTNTPTAWESPTGQVGFTDTYGHIGVTSQDSDHGGGEFTADTWISASTTPRGIFSHTGVADGLTANQGSTTIGFQVQISSLQEAGTDYTNTLTYIATPVF